MGHSWVENRPTLARKSQMGLALSKANLGGRMLFILPRHGDKAK
jgi:hypothetical protein